MHIKTGTWEISVCESDPLCDTASLVSPPNPESQIRNRRLSPGSGSSGGGGGGGGRIGKDVCQMLPPSLESHTDKQPYSHTHAPDRERRSLLQGRSFRKDGPRANRTAERGQRERWVEDSLSLLKPPPAFPVQDSPSKLQPAVSYASKVKRGGLGIVADEPPGIGMLLHNQWGLSFISDVSQNGDSPEPNTVVQNGPSAVSLISNEASAPTEDMHLAPEMDCEQPEPNVVVCRAEPEDMAELLLGCHHLVEAVRYHTQEWEAIYRKHKEDPSKVIWYKDVLDSPA